MSVSIARFLEGLRSTGCVGPSELAALEAKFPTELRQKDAGDLARELVRDGKLTKFQAAALYQDKAAGLVLGNYVLLDKLGEGGMGQVFRARHRRMDRIVALKMLPKKALDAPEKVERFQREVKAAAKLTHPHIVVAYDADEADGIHFLVMEYVEGSDLSSLVKKQGPLPAAQALDFIRQAAQGLQHAHSQGITHRDIKPSNLLLDKHGSVKILDMGLARVDDASPLSSSSAVGQADLTTAGTIMGTVDYMAPEQAMDSRKADARADIYSLGCTLYYLIAGKSPYGGDTLMKRLTAHQQASIPLLSQVAQGVPTQLDPIFQKMLAKRATARYQTMADVMAALDGVVATGKSQPANAPRPVTARAIPNVAAPTSDSDIREARSVLLPGMSAIKKDAKGGSSRGGAKKSSTMKLVLVCVTALIATALGGFLFFMKGGESTQVAANVESQPQSENVAPPLLPLGEGGRRPDEGAPAPHVTPPPSAEPSALVDALPPAGEVMPAAVPSIPAIDSPETNEPPVGAAPPLLPLGEGGRRPDEGAPPPSADNAPSSDAPSEPTPETPEPERLPIPDAAALSKADALLKEIYKDDLAAAKTDEARIALAQRLTEQAGDENDDAAGTYALLQRARELAIDAGDPALAENAIQLVAAKFEVDPLAEWIAALEKMTAKTHTPAVYKAIAEAASARGAQLAGVEQWDDAKRLSDIAMGAGRKSKDVELIKQVTERGKTLATDKKQWDAVEAAKVTLATNPDDAAAHLVLGRYLAFVLGDWSTGFEHLAKSNDSVLRELGAKSVAVPETPEALVAVGDAWWDAADKPSLSKDKENLRAAAGFWYSLAVDDLMGLSKTRIEKRLADVTKAAAASSVGKTSAGNRGATTSNSATGTVVYLDDLPDHDWAGLRNLGKHGMDHVSKGFKWVGATPSHSLFTHPMPKSAAHVRYSIGGSFDTLSATVGLSNTPASALTFQVLGDGQLLWRSLPMKIRDMGVDFVVPVRGVKELVLEVLCPAGSGSAHAVWIEPKLQSKKSLPPKIATKTGTSGPSAGAAPPTDPGVCLRVPQILDCAEQPHILPLGSSFDFTKSWTFTVDFMSTEVLPEVQTIIYISRDGRGGGPFLVRLHGMKIETRIQNTPAYMARSAPVFERGFPVALDDGFLNQWVTVGFHYDATSKEIAIYINGVLKRKDPAVVVPTGESGLNAKVGISPASANNGSRFFGKVRNLRLFNEEAFSLGKAPASSTAPIPPGVPAEKVALSLDALDCASEMREFVIQSAFDESQSWTARLEFQCGARDDMEVQTLFQQFAGTTGHRPIVLALEQGGALKAWIGSDDSRSQTLSAPIEKAATDAWTAVIFRYDSAAKELSMYIDGKLVAKDATKLMPKSNAEIKKLAVGGRTNNSSRFYGKVRGLSLVNEVTFSPPE